MKRLAASLGLGVCLVAPLVAGGTALADGVPTASAAPQTASNQVIERVVFRCQGGIRVQVTRLPGRARVDFAGQSRILNQADGVGGVRYRSGGFAWVNNGKVAYMKDTRSGDLPVSGCVRVN